MANVPERISEKDTDQKNDDSIILAWKAPRFLFYRKNSSWHAGILVIAILCIALVFLLERFGLLQVSPWLAALVIIVGCAALLRRGSLEPADVQYAITEDGFISDDDLIPFETFRAFAIVDLGDHMILRLWPKTRFGLPTSIILDEVNPLDVRDVLTDVLPEEQHTQTVSDYVSRIIRF